MTESTTNQNPYSGLPETTQSEHAAHGHDEDHEQGHDQGHGHAHGWMMLACCIPMLVVAGVLVLTGAVGASFIFSALLCAAMMGVMMFMMPGGHGGHGGHGRR